MFLLTKTCYDRSKDGLCKTNMNFVANMTDDIYLNGLFTIELNIFQENDYFGGKTRNVDAMR